MFKSLLIALVVTFLGACANAGIGISVPIGPFGSIGIGVNAAGQVTGNLGVGTSVGGVGIGGGTSFPIGTVSGAPAQTPTQAPVGSTKPTATQTGSSQTVPK